MKKYLGFHLVELLMTVSIISILAAIGMPFYTQFLTQAHRLEATQTLSKLALAMEKYHIEHQTYKGATLAALHFPEKIAHQHYQLMIQAANNEKYSLAAKPLGKQAKHEFMCANLFLNSEGMKGMSGPGNLEECW